VRWGDEKYVRVYVRDTLDWQALSFEAQGLMTLILRKVDRAGLAKLGKHGKRGVAMLVGHPTRWATIEPALEELLADGCVRIESDTLVVPNFIEAQETPQTDAQRKRSQRERDRDLAAAGVTKTGIESQNVTECHGDTDDGHEESRGVTSCHSDPIRSVPSDPDPPSRASARVADAVPADESPTAPATGAKVRPTTAHNLVHCLKVAMEAARPERGPFFPGTFSPRDADELLRSLGGGQTDEIERRIALFVADDNMAPWTVLKFCRSYNGIGAARASPKPRIRSGIPENFTPDP
jgi:hypothetical protein